MLSLEQLKKSLQDVENDLQRTQEQLKSPNFYANHSQEVSMCFAARDRILKEQQQDLMLAKLDLERQIKELGDEQ